MRKAEKGDKVKVHYTGKVNGGQVFDSSEGRDPIGFVIGSGNVIPGFEKGILGMEEKQKKTLDIPAADAYGPHQEDLVIEVPREQVPDDIKLEVGAMLGMKAPGGQEFKVTVTSIKDDKVKVDGNHPLAGKDLTFDVVLEEIA